MQATELVLLFHFRPAAGSSTSKSGAARFAAGTVGAVAGAAGVAVAALL